MKLRQFITFATMALTATIILGGCNNSNQNDSEAVLENIATRTSIRAFTDQPVDNEIITKILKAGMAAPTAVNSQPWVFSGAYLLLQNRQRGYEQIGRDIS